ncbi:Rpn family recombination-promoting nuclease/putative transposase, partial [Spirulina subsalsa]|uniref:Rpn family recombination-promoting nuclease/putative transposase n=1 Tax=Spirulina subsalsa TaxID=54311 RepID=UPI0003693B23
MKTDSIFYRIFQQYPRSFFELLNRPPTEANNYQFTSVEVKQLAFRLDGLFLPVSEDTTQPFYLAEVQFQPDETLYYRLFAELFLYLRQYQPPHPWQVVVIYPTRSIEREPPQHFRDLLRSGTVTRVYLDELEGVQERLGVSIIQLVVEEESQAMELAQRLIQQAQEVLVTSPIQRDIIDLIETIVVYKLPQLSREEIAEMLGLTDLKQTRFYQEAFEEGRQEGRQEGIEQAQRNLIQRLLSRGHSPSEIAELLDFPL